VRSLRCVVVHDMLAATVEAYVVAVVAVSLNLVSLMCIAPLWRRRRDLMVSANRTIDSCKKLGAREAHLRVEECSCSCLCIYSL
jgi:hypothetical protein